MDVGRRTFSSLTSPEDYYATIYLAEVTNALTNLLFLSLAAKGVANCLQHGHDAVFLLAFLGYGCVGLGSFAFHSTLKCTLQTGS